MTFIRSSSEVSVGEIVICHSNARANDTLAIGQEYEVKQIDLEYLYVINLKGKLDYFTPTRFRKKTVFEIRRERIEKFLAEDN